MIRFGLFDVALWIAAVLLLIPIVLKGAASVVDAMRYAFP